MKYLDTVTENIDRVKKGRENINKGLVFIMLGWIVYIVLSLILYLTQLYFSAIWIAVLGISFLILTVGIVVKREIYSLAILVKNMEER